MQSYVRIRQGTTTFRDLILSVGIDFATFVSGGYDETN